MSSQTALRRLIEAFQRLKIPYMVGGSVASSIHGPWRATADADVIADINPRQVEALAAALSSEFYADAEMMRDALSRRRGFNVIHYDTAFKIDIFPLLDNHFAMAQFERRIARDYAPPDMEPLQVEVSTPEDTILSKLAWYREGGEVSEKQWSDIRGIIAVKGGSLDLEYLRKWAAYLRVSDLLNEILQEANHA